MAVDELDLTPELRRFLAYARNPPRVRWTLLTVCEVGAVIAFGVFWAGLGWCVMVWIL